MGVKVFPTNGDTVTGIDNVTFVNQPLSYEYNPHKIGQPVEPPKDTSLAAEIRNSEAYKSAEAIFLADKKYGEMYLNRLAMIPSAYKNADRTGFDNINWSNKADDKDLAAYNDAIIKIQNLVGEYYEFINTLPTSQVSQASDAGFNLAQSGQVGSSQMNVQPMDPSSSNQMESTQALEVFGQGISTIANIASVGSAVAGVYKAFSDVALNKNTLDFSKDLEWSKLGMNEKQFVSSAVSHLAEQGYDILGNNINTIDDLIRWYDISSADWKNQDNINRSFLSWFQSNLSSSPLQRQLDLHDGLFESLIASRYNKLHGSNRSVNDVMKILSQYKMDSFILDQKYGQIKSQYEVEYLQGLDASDIANADMKVKVNEGIAALHESDLTALKSHYISQFSDQFLNATSPADRFAILQVLYDMNIDDIESQELINKCGSAFLGKLANKGIDTVLKSITEAVGGLANPVGKVLGKAIGGVM